MEPVQKVQKALKKKHRVVDHVSEYSEEGWNNENVQWRKVMLHYDKKFSTVEACINYDKAIAAGNIDLATELQNEIYGILDEAFAEFSKEIVQEEHVHFKLMDKTVGENLLSVEQQIHDAKKANKNPRELLELVLIKLTLLRDLARLGTRYDLAGDIHALSVTQGLSPDEYLQRILELPLVLDTQEIKKEIGPGLPSPIPYQDYALNTQVLPVFSRNGSMGFNSILYAIFNGYLPVGFGVNPLPVHVNYHEQEAFWTARHDYGHCFNRVLAHSPEFFNQCKDIYFSLFGERTNNEIDDNTFKKELLMLFFIVYECSYTPGQSKSVENIIKERTTLPEESRFKTTLFKRKELPKHEREPLPVNTQTSLKRATILETVDFIKPLQDLGYTFPKSETLKNKPWKAAAGLRSALIDILDGFAERHPELDVGCHGQKKPVMR